MEKASYWKGEEVKSDKIKYSFRKKLLLCFVISSVIPIVLSCIFLIQSMKFKVQLDYTRRNNEMVAVIEDKFSETFAEIEDIAGQFAETAYIKEAMENSIVDNKYVYNKLYDLSSGLRDKAIFSIYSVEGKCLYTTGNTDEAKKLPNYCGILKTANTHRDSMVVRKEQHYRSDETILLRSVKAIINEQDEIVGYFSAAMGERELENILKGCYSSKDKLYIFNEFLEPVYMAGVQDEENVITELRHRYFTENDINGPRMNKTVSIDAIEDYGLYVLLVRPEIFTGDITKSMYIVLVILAVLSFILCFVISSKMSKRLYEPVDILNKGMSRVREGDFDVRLVPVSDDELGQLTDNFNDMAQDIKSYMEEQVRQQKKLNETETAMMQAQLNPHFLYNTLDTIKWAGKANGSNEVAILSTRLAKILRVSISEDKFIKLEDELKLVEYYAEIQEIRFEGHFVIEDRIPEEMKSCYVPKLVIQPIVENSVIHGFKDSNGGKVIISGSIVKEDCKEKMLINITDDGCGIDEEVIDRLNDKNSENMRGHIGFYNVKNIINLNYGTEYGVVIGKNEPQGTRVTISMPVVRGGEDHVQTDSSR
ncbi:MAG: histidine kinase [Eubacteriales bacterium]|nr:histidine kinase [Eubacteriales bacterium]